MQFDYFNFNQDDDLMSIEDLRALRLQKQKVESDKKARKYILDINQRFRIMSARKNNKFLKEYKPFLKNCIILLILICLIYLSLHL